MKLDNRDSMTTVIHLDRNDSIQVNPIEVFLNMVENFDEDLYLKYKKMISQDFK